MFLNVDPVGQEHGWSVSPQGGREAEVSKGRARVTAVIKCSILTKKIGKGDDGQRHRSKTIGKEKKRPGPNLLYEIQNSQGSKS